jgi:D-proline reductase (dithiol) PrdB
MTTTREPIDYIERTRTLYSSLNYPSYEWVNEQSTPFSKPSKSLKDSRVGLICSGGIYLKGQIAFHFKDDTSYRVIDSKSSNQDLRATHFAYDLKDARDDINVVFPIDTLRRLTSKGFIGGIADNVYSFMGGIYSSRKVRELLAPNLARQMTKDEVDLVILVPA